jgi:hypothetical protein
MWCTCRWRKGDVWTKFGITSQQQTPDCRSKYVQKYNIRMDFREVVYDSISGAIKAANILTNWVTNNCLTRNLYPLVCQCSTTVLYVLALSLSMLHASFISEFFLCADCCQRLLMVALQGSLACLVCSLWIWWRHDCRTSRLGQMANASTFLCEFVIVVMLEGIL